MSVELIQPEIINDGYVPESEIWQAWGFEGFQFSVFLMFVFFLLVVLVVYQDILKYAT